MHVLEPSIVSADNLKAVSAGSFDGGLCQVWPLLLGCQMGSQRRGLSLDCLSPVASPRALPVRHSWGSDHKSCWSAPLYSTNLREYRNGHKSMFSIFSVVSWIYTVFSWVRQCHVLHICKVNTFGTVVMMLFCVTRKQMRFPVTYTLSAGWVLLILKSHRTYVIN